MTTNSYKFWIDNGVTEGSFMLELWLATSSWILSGAFQLLDGLLWLRSCVLTDYHGYRNSVCCSWEYVVCLDWQQDHSRLLLHNTCWSPLFAQEGIVQFQCPPLWLGLQLLVRHWCNLSWLHCSLPSCSLTTYWIYTHKRRGSLCNVTLFVDWVLFVRSWDLLFDLWRWRGFYFSTSLAYS